MDNRNREGARLNFGLALLTVITVAAGVMYLTPIANVFYGTMFNRIAFMVLPLIPAGFAFLAWHRSTGSPRVAYRMGGMAMVANGAYGFLVGFFPHLTDPRAIPIIDIVFILSVYVPGIIGGFLATTNRKNLTYLIDGVLAGTSLLFISWNFLASEVLKQFPHDTWGVIVAMASPMFDAMLVTMALLAARRGTMIFARQTVLCFAASEATDGANDIVWATHGMHVPMPSLCMFFWAVHIGLLSLTFLSPSLKKDQPEGAASLKYIMFPYVPPVLAAVAAVWMALRQTAFSNGAAILGGLVVVALVVRQLMAVLDHLKVSQQLAHIVHELKVRELELEHLSNHDALTALPNRRYLSQKIVDTPATTSFSVLLVDLDDFKIVNDTLGHDVGDALLRYVADILTSHVRYGDTVSRLGGDEFAVLLEGADIATAKAIAERIVETLKQTFNISGYDVNVGCSIGLSWGDNLADFDNALRQADMAMYQRKRSDDKGGVAIFSV